MTRRELEKLGLEVVRFTMRERRRDGHREIERFPLTGEHIACICRRLRRPVGEHRAYAIRDALLAAGRIAKSGQYAKKDEHGNLTGYKVRLYRFVRQAGRKAPPKDILCPQRKFSTRRSCWSHPLFGDPEHGQKLREWLRKWKEPPPWSWEWPDELKERDR